MGTIVQIKRTANVAAPTTSDLLEGELGYSEDKSNNGAGAKLYVGSLNSSGSAVIDTIGGKYYTTTVDAATNNNTASTIVKRDGSGNFSAGTITASLTGTATSAGIATTANALTTARDIGLSGDLTGNVSFDGSQNVTLTATIAANSVALGTDTTGNYVANVIPGTGLTGSGFGTEGATPTLALAASGVTATTYGGSSQIPVLTVDTYGRVTAAANASITVASSAFTTISVSGQSDVVADTATDTLTLASGTGITLTTDAGNDSVTITNSGVTQLTGTSNEVEVSGSTGSITIGLPDNVTIGNNLTVTGDLIVNGTAVTMNTATVVVEDPLVKFGNANPADSLDIGFFGEYTNSGTKYAGLFRDASDSGKFKLFTALTTSPTNNVITVADYTVATLVANLSGGTVSGLSSAIGVADGGTGANTFTTNGVLFGQGTSAIAVATGTAGQVLQLNASGVPTFGGIDGGTY